MNFPGKLSNSDADHFLQSIVTMPKLTVIQSWALSKCPWPIGYEDEDKVSSSNIRIIDFSRCKLTDEFFPRVVTLFATVKELILPWNNFIIVPECIKECIFLKKLDLSNCEYLQVIRGIPPNLKCFKAEGSKSLTSSCRSMLLNQDLHEAGNTEFYLPTTEIPEWFEHRSSRTSISFWFRNKFPPLVLYFRAVANYPSENLCAQVIILAMNGKEYWLLRTNTDTCVIDLEMCKSGYNFCYNLNEWNQAELRYKEYHCSPTCMKTENHVLATLVEIGIHVLKQEYSMEDIRFTDPCKKRKLEDDLNSSEPKNNRLLKKHRFVDMEICKTQFEKQQQCMGFMSHLWNWVRSGFSLLPTLGRHSLDDNVNEDSSSMMSTQIRDNIGLRGEADGVKD